MLAETNSTWSTEMSEIHHIDRLFQQQKIFNDIHELINAFNEDVVNLKNKTLITEFEWKYLKLYMLTLNQELWIIKDFEHIEEKLVERVDNFVTDKNTVQSKIMQTNARIEDLRMDIEKYIEHEKAISAQFMSNCKGTQFFAFLKRIYQKKIKPTMDLEQEGVLIRNCPFFFQIKCIFSTVLSSSSSSSSVSSSEDEDDEISRDSADIVHIYLDETICPTGCDRQQYNLVFELRAQRHCIEERIRNAKDEIQKCKTECISLEKGINDIDQKLAVENESLIKFTVIF